KAHWATKKKKIIVMAMSCKSKTDVFGGIGMSQALRGRFDGHSWEAASRWVDPDGSGEYSWRIAICSDGTFDISESDRELTGQSGKQRGWFESLAQVKSYCWRTESLLVDPGLLAGMLIARHDVVF